MGETLREYGLERYGISTDSIAVAGAPDEPSHQMLPDEIEALTRSRALPGQQETKRLGAGARRNLDPP
jgi:hypothetical protein